MSQSTSLVLAAAASIVLVIGGGRADAGLIEFTFSYSGSNVGGGTVSGSGTLLGVYEGGEQFLLKSGTGTSLEAGNLTLQHAGTWINSYAPSVNLTSDNQLYSTSNPLLSSSGLVFSGDALPANGPYFSISGNGADSYTYYNNYNASPLSSGQLDSFTIKLIGPLGGGPGSGPTGPGNSAPEPGSLSVLGLGLACLGACGWIRRRKATAAAV